MPEPRPPVAPAAYPAFPPPQYPQPQYPLPRPRRRWPITVGVVAASAVVAATIAAVVAVNVAGNRADSGTSTAATVTVATPPAPAKPAPLPAADADRRTCQAWLAAGDQIHAASAAQSVIPKGMTILDPAVRDNPDWSAAVRKAADSYGKAGDTLAAGIAPGTTTILDQAATTAAAALHTLSTGYGTFDAANGNTYHVMRETADTMDVLCERLAPR